MATLSVTNTFSAGTTIVAADMNQNFTDVETFVNSSPGLIQNDIVDAKGDVIAATASNTVTRLAVGTNTYVLTADSSESTGLKWAPSPAVDVVTTKGDLIAATAADTIARLGVGSNNQVLIADSSESTGLKWAVSPPIDEITTKGDIIAGTAADTISRLGVGSNTQVLTADSSTGTGLAWTTPTAGTVTSVTGTAPIVSTGGATPAISVTTNHEQLILNNQIFS